MFITRAFHLSDVMEITDSEILLDNYSDDRVTEVYREYRDDEGIPVHHSLFYNERNDLETGPWDRTGQRGAFVNLHGVQGVFDLQLHELVPGGETTTQHHLFEEIILVSQGHGATKIGRGDDSVVFEWQENSLFLIPQGVPYKHVNYSEDEPAKLFAQTLLPQLLEFIRNVEFIFNPEYDFWERSFKDEDFYSADGELYNAQSRKDKAVWDANFVPDLVKFDKLQPRAYRGAGTNIGFNMPQTSMWVHAAEFPKGTYKKAHHRAGPAAIYTILSGEGYSTMWQPGWEEIGKIEWSAGSIISYPHDCLHQHFNTGSEPARYLAWHNPKLGTLGDIDVYSSKADENQIEYHEEDPVVREHYEEQLEKSGGELQMPEECYTNPDFEWGDQST